MATGDLEELQHLLEDLMTKMEQVEVVSHLMASCLKQKRQREESVLSHVLTQQSMFLKNGEVEIVTTVRPKQ